MSSYTPTTWATGDTITATAMNKIENGIANAGGGGVDVQIWFVDSNTGFHAEGDFASALEKASSGLPLVAYFYNASNINGELGFYSPVALGTFYQASVPNVITLPLDSVSGYEWSAYGVVYYD